MLVYNSHSKAFPSSVGRPNKALKEADQAQVHLEENLSDCPSPNRKRPSDSCLAEGGQMGAKTNQRGKATGSSSSVEVDGGGRKEEVVQEQATTLGEIPCGWTRVKLEPDC
jgi:hypothetical protein